MEPSRPAGSEDGDERADEARLKARGGANPSERIIHLLWVGAFIVITVLALHLTPNPSGTGTHTQLGLPPCGLHQRFGIPCLSCGMTTSFAHMVRFQVLRGLHANPLGAMLYVVFLAGAVLSLASTLSGWSFFGFLARRDWTRIGILTIAFSLGSWCYKFLTGILL